MKQSSPARKKALLVKALVAVCGSAGSVCVLLMAPTWGVCIFLSVVAALAAYEFTTATRFVTHRYLVVLTVLQAVGVIWAVAYRLPPVFWGVWLFSAFALAFTPAVFTEKAAGAHEGAAAVFAAFVPSGITALFLYLMQLPGGRVLLLSPLVAAWAADSPARLSLKVHLRRPAAGLARHAVRKTRPTSAATAARRSPRRPPRGSARSVARRTRPTSAATAAPRVRNVR